MNLFSPCSSSVLTIKNFPLIFNDNDRQEFLEHFGAIRVCCISRFKNLSNIIIADFGTNNHASQGLTRLHQLEMLNRRLVVEYCPLELVELAFSSNFSSNNDIIENDLLHGISPGINQIRYALPSERLSYKYPAIDETILTNINNALLSVPSFYTQVLHLMNKMSLPCPMITDSRKFQRTLSTMNIACQTDKSSFSQVINMDTDEDESEIDDGEEEQRIKRRYRSILKTPMHKGTISTSQPDMTIDIAIKRKPKIELKIPQKLIQSRIDVCDTTPIDVTIHNFGRMEPIVSRANIISKEDERIPLIPLDEIYKNRLNEDQLRLIDNGRLYRNYERGQPSTRLYIKNINTKYVDERLLHSIYDRYRRDSFPIDIHLMREGKMKGQAFVTFSSEEMALYALNDTNGFVLHEKPLIVQFARTIKSKDMV